MKFKDTLGVEILPVDTVTVTAYGCGGRVADCGRLAAVAGFGRSRVIIEFTDGEKRAIGPGCLAVRRRDGKKGHEGNRELVVTVDPARVAELKATALVGIKDYRPTYVMLEKNAGPADGLEAARQIMPGAAFSHLKFGQPVYLPGDAKEEL